MKTIKDIICLDSDITRYIKSLKANKYSYNTVDNYNITFNKLKDFAEIKYNNLEFDLSTFKSLVFEFIDSIDEYSTKINKEKINTKYKVSSVNAKRTHLREFINFLYDRERISMNFSDKIKILKRERGEEKSILTLDEIQKIVKMLDKQIEKARGYDIYIYARNKFLFVILLTTGMRISEAINLKWENVSIEKEEIRINKSKGKKSRDIPINTELKLQIYEFQRILNKLNTKYSLENNYIFFSRYKEDFPMTSKNGELIINRIIKKAKIEKKITAHSLRHTLASHYIANGGAIPALANILGHSSPRVTMEIYAHPISEKEKKKEMNKVKYGIN